MRHIHLGAILLTSLLTFVGTIDAQRTTKKPATKKPVTTRILPPLEVRAGREKVETQLSNVNLFIDKYGPKAEALELLDRSYASKRVSQATIAKHELNKKNTVLTIRNLREGLATLESEFRTKVWLKKYLPTIQGITDLASDAEDSALAGKFVAAKMPLRDVSKHLTDTLTTMPK